MERNHVEDGDKHFSNRCSMYRCPNGEKLLGSFILGAKKPQWIKHMKQGRGQKKQRGRGGWRPLKWPCCADS